MRILHLVHRAWPYHGGAERYVLEHAAAAREWGHSSVIAATDAWDMSWLISGRGRRIEGRRDIHDGIPVIRFPVVHPPLQNIFRGVLARLCRCGPDRFHYPNPFIPSLRQWIKQDKGFDLVHANAMPFMLNAGWEYSRRHGSGLVSVPHANVGEKYRRVDALHYFTGCQKRVLRESSFVVAQSRFEACLYREMGIPEERIHISGSGISPNEFRDISGERGRRRHGLDGRVVLCLTAHSVQRGTGHLLKASEILKNRGTEHTLVLAGPVMDDAQELLNDFVPPGAGDDPVVTGYIRQSERLDLIAAADAVVLPSRLDCFGIVLLEAWMLGKPVVGCWSGAMPDLIREGENGYLVPWGDPETLAHRTGLLLKNVEAGRDMGERGREQVLKKWTWKRITDDFYRRLAHCFSRGAGS